LNSLFRKGIYLTITAVVLYSLSCQAASISLPKPLLTGTVSVEEALAKRRSIRTYSSDPLKIEEAGQLLWAAQGISGAGGKRTAPSAGAQYPLELYLVAGAVSGVKPGIYRYLPENHSLEPVAAGDLRAQLAANAGMQGFIKDAPAMVIFCANYGKAGRYAERGRAFVDFEVGHAAENLALEAVALGLGSVMIGAYDVTALGKSLNIPASLTAVYVVPVGHSR